MGETPKYKWPYPEGGDKPQGHIQMKALASKIEQTVSGIAGAYNKKLVFGVFTSGANVNIPYWGWASQPVDKAVADPGKWFDATKKAIMLPAGLYAVVSETRLHLSQNRRHVTTTCVWTGDEAGTLKAGLGQSTNEFQGSSDLTHSSTALLHIPTGERRMVRPGAFSFDTSGDPVLDQLWPTTAIYVVRLLDSTQLTFGDLPLDPHLGKKIDPRSVKENDPSKVIYKDFEPQKYVPDHSH